MKVVVYSVLMLSLLGSLVATSSSPTSPDSYYSWSGIFSSIASQADGWTIGDNYFSFDGSDWTYIPRGTSQMAIYATAVPEPAAGVLFGLGALLFGLKRRQHRTMI